MYTSYLFGFGMQRAITHAGCKFRTYCGTC